MMEMNQFRIRAQCKFGKFSRKCQAGFLAMFTGVCLVMACGCKRDEDKVHDAKPTREPESASLLWVELTDAQIERIGIKTTPAKSGAYHPTTQVFGRVVINPNATFDINSPFAGELIVDKEWPKIASVLSRGQVIGKIKVRSSPEVRADLQNRMLDAVSRLPSDRNAVESLTRIVEGLQRIASKEVLSRTELDIATSNLARARAQVALDESAVKHWKSVLEAIDTPPGSVNEHWLVPIMALHEGQVTEVSIAGRSYVEAGQHLLRTVNQSTHLIRLDIPPDMETAGITDRLDLLVSCLSHQYEARFEGLASTVDTSSQFRHLLFSINDASRGLRPGMLVRAKFPVNSDTTDSSNIDAIQIPSNALIYHQGLPYVFVQSDSDRFERRSVSLIGQSSQDLFVKVAADKDRELRIGVQADEQVVVSGAQVLLSRQFLQAGGDND